MLGAAGAVEAIFQYCLLMIRVSAIDNLVSPDKGTDNFDLVPLKSKKKSQKYFVKLFGFGGTNATLIIGELIKNIKIHFLCLVYL